ncbi:hypothetical protein TNCV_4361761 [Trichonephila clavipes]|nr:hypothetical protein TNCV_4361761 [Trichonephila clavipes]
MAVKRSRGDVHHRESCRQPPPIPKMFDSPPRKCPSSFDAPPKPKSVPPWNTSCPCVRGRLSQPARGNRGLMVVKGLKTTKKCFQELGLYAIALEKAKL